MRNAVTVCVLLVTMLLLQTACGVRAGRPAEEHGDPHVYLIIVDGLDSRWLADMPELRELRASGACAVTYREARAVLPARTNTNHATLLTGVYPVEHGITGNAYWDGDPAHRPAKLDNPSMLEVETLFTVVETERPRLRTVGVFGKRKLGRLFSAVPGRQRAPDVLWAPETFRADDHATMNAALRVLEVEPAFAVVSLSWLDGVCHRYGTKHKSRLDALVAVDAEIARFIDHLREAGRWERSVVFITGDHGFTDIRPPPGRHEPYISFGAELDRHGISGIRPVSEGTLGHVYLDGASRATPLDAASYERLRQARRVALEIPGVAEALYRLPVPGEGAETTLAGAHPDWRIDHPRIGDLVLVAEPGIVFSDPVGNVEQTLPGNHGGPGETKVPLVICGGASQIRPERRRAGEVPSAADTGATMLELLGVRGVRRLDGHEMPSTHRGVTITAVGDS